MSNYYCTIKSLVFIILMLFLTTFANKSDKFFKNVDLVSAKALKKQQFNKLSKHALTKRIQIVKVDTSKFSNDILILDLFEKKNISIQRDKTVKNNRVRGSLTWTKNNDHKNNINLIKRNNRITGNLRVDGVLYLIRSLDSDGNHALIEIDQTKYRGCARESSNGFK